MPIHKIRSLGRADDAKSSSRHYSDRGAAPDRPGSWVGERALLGELECDQRSRWLFSRSKDPYCWVELLLHCHSSKSNDLRCYWSNEHPQRIEADFAKCETAKVQLFRSHRDSRKALSGRALCHRFRTLTPCS